MERGLTPCSSPPLVMSTTMTGLTDLVVLPVGKLYGKIQEREPLPVIISALVIIVDLGSTYSIQC